MALLLALLAADCHAEKLTYRERIDNEISQKIESALEDLLDKNLFHVKASAAFTTYHEEDVFLGKLGTVKSGRGKSRISKVTVYLFLDDSVKKEKVADLKNIILNVVPYVERGSIKIKLERFHVNKLGLTVKHAVENLQTFLKKYSYILAFLLSLMLIGFVAIALGQFARRDEAEKNKFKSFFKRKARLFKTKKKETSDYGFSLFCGLCKEDPGKAALIVNYWLDQSTLNYEHALAYIANKTDAQFFLNCLKKLPLESQQAWKAIVMESHDNYNAQLAEDFLVSECMEYWGKSSSKCDDAIIANLLNMSPEQMLEFVELDPKLNFYIIGLLNQEKAAWLMERISSRTKNRIIDMETRSGRKEIDPQDALRAIEEFRENQCGAKPSSFVDTIIEHAPYLDELEIAAIYKNFKKEKAPEKMQKFFQIYFPRQLFFQVQNDLLAIVISKLCSSLKKDLYYVLEGSEHEKFFALIRNDSNLMADIDMAKKNKFYINSVEERKEEIHRNFAANYWNVMRNNEKAFSMGRKTLDEWIKSKFYTIKAVEDDFPKAA